MPPGNKPLLETVLTQIYVAIVTRPQKDNQAKNAVMS